MGLKLLAEPIGGSHASTIYLSIYLSVYLSIYLSIYVSIYLSIYRAPQIAFSGEDEVAMMGSDVEDPEHPPSPGKIARKSHILSHFCRKATSHF